MSATTIHFVRHGKVYNPDHLLYERLPDFHLSDLGRRMAQATAAYLANSPQTNTISAVYSSPLDRTRETADAALSMLDVDHAGLDVMDRKLLGAVIDKFGGGPVGLDNVAAAIGESSDTIEDVLEPYLIQQGLLQRTPRGRVATLAAYEHFGLEPRGRGAGLFDE